MLGKDLSEALSGISDDKIEAAAHVVPGSRRHIWIRVAACAAVLAILLTMFFWSNETGTEDGKDRLVAMPGALKAYACDLDKVETGELDKYELDSTKPFLYAIHIPAMNVTNIGSPITFCVQETYFENAEITFEISADYENFCKKQTLKNGESIRFRKVPYKEIQADIGEKGNFFLDILILADGEIVGYGVVSFCFYFGNATFAFEFKTVCYPYVDGERQDISEAYVREQIEAYKQSKVHGEGYEIIRQFYENDEK